MKLQVRSVSRWRVRNRAWMMTLFLFAMLSTISPRSAADTSAAFTPPGSITVTMHRLFYPGGGRRAIPCTIDPPDVKWGCTWFDEDHHPQDIHPYPYTSNPITVSIETDYLLDVVPQELGTYYHPTALHAQAIAARSYAYYKIDNGFDMDNSSSGNQAFIPYKFEGLFPETFPDNEHDPCASGNLNTGQQIVCDAVASHTYISYGTGPNDDSPAFTEFHADTYAQTTTHPEQSTQYPYMLGVQDPISTACDANDFGHGHGMSGEGASRWAHGNQCSQSAAGNTPWSVQWEHAEQILVHYYTNIHLRDADGAQLTDGYRWNPLSIDWHTPDNQPPTMEQGSAYSVTVQVQNTSVYDWPVGGQTAVALSYLWAKPGFEEKPSLNRDQITVEIPQGDPPYTFTLSIDDLPDWGPCPYWLKFDVLITWDRDYWFSETYDWPTHDVAINVGETCEPIFIPLLLKDH